MRTNYFILLVFLTSFTLHAQQQGVQSIQPSAAYYTGTVSQSLTVGGRWQSSVFSVTESCNDKAQNEFCDWITIVNDISGSEQADLLRVSFGDSPSITSDYNTPYIRNFPTISYTGTVTDVCAGGIIEASDTSVVGNLKEAYWVAFGDTWDGYEYCNGDLKVVRIEFRINGNELQVRNGEDKYYTTLEDFTLDNFTDTYFSNYLPRAYNNSSGIDWQDNRYFAIDLVEISATTRSGSQTIGLGSSNIMVGLPYMGIIQAPYLNTDPTNYTQNYSKHLGFPWSVNYFPSTFQDNGFTVSKGYYSDRVELNWRVFNNADRITGFEIYRTEDINSSNPVWGQPIRNLSASSNSFVDQTTEGGKLYRYKVKALSVITGDPDILYDSFIEGVGYRNPTGIITGNVSYQGGNPVKDVTISAVPDGGFTNIGSALSIPSNGFITIPRFHEELRDSITLQAWVKPAAEFTAGSKINLFKMSASSGDELDITLGVVSSTTVRIEINDFTFDLSNYFPNGKITNNGEDDLSPVSEFHNQFNHITTRFSSGETPSVYINGRKVDAEYVDYMNELIATDTDLTLTATLSQISSSTFNISVDPDGNAESFVGAQLGGGIEGYLDEVRFYNKALDDKIIRRDYKRILKGNDAGIHTYLRMDEKSGYYAYDLAHSGFTFFGNNANLKSSTFTSDAQRATFTTLSNQKPTSDQLGILGVTDENGNYVVASVPYGGTGETYIITPSLGKHQFAPNQEIAFIGVGAEVLNNVDFIDESSFTFRGRILYDSRGVFPSGPDSDDVTGDIRDNEAYNAYVVGDEKYPKGEYWATYGTGTESSTIIRLERYAPIPLSGAYVYIDNQLVVGAGNNPVETDDEGRFTIEVPIGLHSISVQKSSHEFEHEGRFPKKETLEVNGETKVIEHLFDFYEDQDEEVVFIDNTKVSYIGRVVGGSVESSKPLGFGYDGEKSYQVSSTAPIEIYTSKNNIGTASITLGYRQPGVSSITDDYKTIFSTHPDTGEFRIDLLPLQYELNQNDLYIPSQTDSSIQRFLDASQTLNLSSISQELVNHYIVENDTVASTLPFNYQSKFIYRATPEITVLEQTSETEVEIDSENGAVTYTVSNTGFNIYSQGGKYKLKVQKQERYYNYQLAEDDQLDTVPVTDGELVITNNLADTRSGSEYIVEDENDTSISTYYFIAGVPNTDVSSNFGAGLSVLYRLNEQDYSVSGYQSQGIILGSKSSGGQTFETAGPELPDIILRDPPGSESSASIASGSSFSTTKKNAGGVGTSINAGIKVKAGLKIGVGGGILGPIVESESYVEAGTGIGVGFSSNFGSELTTNYSFNQKVSTSSDPDWVGADADLYIGTSYNQFYGVMDDISVTQNSITDTDGITQSISLETSSGTLFVSKTKALFFSPGEDKTIFIYSQWQIINEIIPFYNDIYENYECIVDGSDPCPLEIDGDVKPKVWYSSQINLWRRVIQTNEETKYLANSNRPQLRDRIENGIFDNFSPESSGGSTSTTLLNPAGGTLNQLFDQNFYENISFDSGVGEFTKSISSGKTNVDSYSFTFELEQTNELEVVLNYSGSGGTINFENKNTSSYEHSGDDTVENTLEVSYTLKDGDDYNKLSVDVINAFDGNGPVFITKGGETSCPVEEATYSYFFNPEVQPLAESGTDTVVVLSEEDRVEISKGTIALEVPFISVENASLSGIPSARAAEFKISLRNDSVLEPLDSDFTLYVDQTTNPNNAIINLDDFGTPFYLSGSETVEYTITLEKGSEDVFDYEDIRIVFESMCDDDLSEEIFISASFIESCSSVELLSPQENWVVNQSNGFNSIGESIPLEIELQSFDIESDSFKRIDLEYRLEGSPTWTNLKTFVASETVYDDLIANGESNVATITDTEFSFSWDVAGNGMADGDYELRARASCFNDTEYISIIIPGKVDLSAPVLFGTPSPSDGVLSLGDNIMARFSEPIKSNGTLTRYEFKVQKNQLPVNHEVSLSFSADDHIAEISRPSIQAGDFSIEFWLKNEVTSGSARLISQSEGVNVQLTNNQLTFVLGSETITAGVQTDGTYNHYALSYEASSGIMKIIENDTTLEEQNVTQNLNFASNQPLSIGGENFRGNIHDLRFWRKAVSREDAVALMNELLNGNENNLIGYWPMNEGFGLLAHDLSRSKHLQLTNVNWDIFPKTTSYIFDGSNYLRLNEVSRAVVTPLQDLTLSFWFKTGQTGPVTLISNGRGDDTDIQGSNGYSNKWAIGIDSENRLSLNADGESYSFGETSINDNIWHHAAVVVRRFGNMLLFIDGERSASHSNEELGGFSGSTIFIGARGQIQSDNSAIVDQYFNGNIDELRLWNMAKSATQIKEDMNFEADYEDTGMLLYSPFNEPEQANNNGPKYWYPYNSSEMRSDYASLDSSALSYSNLAPALKPKRPTERLIVEGIINHDEILLNPQITDWASIENKIAYITVANLYDMSDNMQQSPVTWTAFINKNPLKWYIEGEGNSVDYVKEEASTYTFEITIQNRSGVGQPYSINTPYWINIQESSGSVPPSGTIKLTATVQSELSSGLYEDQLVLTSDYSFNETIDISLRVTAPEPNWSLTPTDFEQSLTLIGKIRLDNNFSIDPNDRLVAYRDNEVRGVVGLTYEEDYDDYFAYLTVYSNTEDTSNITFKIWDASAGRLKDANVNSAASIPFNENALLGNFQNPLIFDNNGLESQNIIFNSGWTWISFNVSNVEFSSLNTVFESLDLETSDKIQSSGPALFDQYEDDPSDPNNSGWFGTISSSNGLSNQKMYKVKLENGQKLLVSGTKVDLSQWSFEIQENWNWLPFVVGRNVPINDALANYTPQNGDLIKSQNQFAIYDGANGWKGSLTYLYQGQGYMLNASTAQTFSYDDYLNNSERRKSTEEETITAPLTNKLFTGFSSNMNLIGNIPESFDGIRVYNESNQLVGESFAGNNFKDGYRQVYATIYGNDYESLTVYLVCEEDETLSNFSLVYVPDALYGTINTPVLIDVDTLIEATFNAAPNPFVNFINIAFKASSHGWSEVSIYDINNRNIKSKELKVVEGDNALRIEIDQVPKGTYILQLHFKGNVYSKVLIKE